MSEEKARSLYIKARFDFFSARYENGDWFTCQLFRLFQKADAANRTLLSIPYPIEYRVFMDWYNAPNEETFFAEELAMRKRAREFLLSKLSSNEENER